MHTCVWDTNINPIIHGPANIMIYMYTWMWLTTDGLFDDLLLCGLNRYCSLKSRMKSSKVVSNYSFIFSNFWFLVMDPESIPGPWGWRQKISPSLIIEYNIQDESFFYLFFLLHRFVSKCTDNGSVCIWQRQIHANQLAPASFTACSQKKKKNPKLSLHLTAYFIVCIFNTWSVYSVHFFIEAL